MSTLISSPDTGTAGAIETVLACSSEQEACPYCDCVAANRLFTGVKDRLGFVPGQWDFWQCDACGAARLHPMPNAEELAAYYPEVYSFAPDLASTSWLKRVVSRLEYQFLFRRLYDVNARRVAKVVGRGDGQRRLLDIGCGRGFRLLSFQRLGFDVSGTEFLPQLAQYVEEELAIPMVCSHVAGLPDHLESQSFDVLTAHHVLEHVVDARELLTTAQLLLKPGGWFVVEVPLVDSWQASTLGDSWCPVTEAPRHVTLPSQKALTQLAIETGYEQVSVKPSSVLDCAPLIALSLIPGAATTAVYQGTRSAAIFRRLLAVTLAALAVPLCLIENYVLHRPPHGFVFMRKP